MTEPTTEPTRTTASTSASTDAELSKQELAALAAHDIEPGSFVNLGIGQPTLISDYLRAEQDRKSVV